MHTSSVVLDLEAFLGYLVLFDNCNLNTSMKLYLAAILFWIGSCLHVVWTVSWVVRRVVHQACTCARS